MNGLFPTCGVQDPARIWHGWNEYSAEFDILPGEVRSVLLRARSGNPAPGPDGVTLAVWRKIVGVSSVLLARLFSMCLRDGVFPQVWKVAALVLIPKKIEVNVVVSARPICLLNDVAKILERVILDRMLAHMDAEPRSRLSARQFGFREGLSTVDALQWVVEHVRRCFDRGHFAIAVGLDIANAFNSLPWRAIRWALERKGLFASRAG